MTNTSNTASSTDESFDLQRAYEATAPDRAALTPNELMALNLDPQAAAALVLSNVAKALTLRDEAAELGKFDLANFDKLQSYAQALWYAHGAMYATSESNAELPALMDDASKLREMLVLSARLLSYHGLVDGKALAELTGSAGYANVVTDLTTLVKVFRDNWSEIENKSPIQKEQVDEAHRIANRLAGAYTARTQVTVKGDLAAEERTRAFTLLVRAYDQVQRAATFIRWGSPDGDKFLPSLWTNARSSKKEEPKPVVDGTEDTVPGAEPLAPVVPQAGKRDGVNDAFPGGSPFTA